ncbi:myeloid-derived growth factor [Spea bombifrons]|uniref:myeloid-derived growth factor n=1 Tax=Spea bombifrons TaxID=233779 RepID=UPI00234BBF6A|nr:myeloid-derived growth factor [Spea bombifrons]
MSAAGVFAVAFLFLVGIRAEENSSTEEFDVRPGGLEHSYSRSLGEYTCTFTYVAQGGTNEKWQMSVGVSEDDKLFSCSVWRPQGKSYLFFMQFRAAVTGGKIEFSEAYSQASADGRSDVPLKKSEYDVTDTAVFHRPGSFSSSLSKLVIVARSAHDEL